jgi:hypothetical protein
MEEVSVGAYKALEALVGGGKPKLADAIVGAYFTSAAVDLQNAARTMLINLLPTYHLGRHHNANVTISRQHAAWILGTAQLIVSWCAAAA